MTSLD